MVRQLYRYIVIEHSGRTTFPPCDKMPFVSTPTTDMIRGTLLKMVNWGVKYEEALAATSIEFRAPDVEDQQIQQIVDKCAKISIETDQFKSI